MCTVSIICVSVYMHECACARACLLLNFLPDDFYLMIPYCEQLKFSYRPNKFFTENVLC